MEMNILIVGVGGQGILTIAQAISQTALEQGYHVKQSEVHGMSQRGGAVQAHLRFADHVVHSDLVPLGKADMLIAVEPLEALRYEEYCNEHTTIVANSVPFRNINNYPPVDGVLERVAQMGPHVLIDARKWAQHAGSARAENMVMLGAASLFTPLPVERLHQWIRRAFAGKGARIVEVNQRAMDLGRALGALYQDQQSRGRPSAQVREWLAELTPEQLKENTASPSECFDSPSPSDALSDAALSAISATLDRVQAEGRRRLYEHEVYSLLEAAGAIAPPKHVFIPCGGSISEDTLAQFAGDRVVLKVVSRDIVHKSESGGVAFVGKSQDAVAAEIRRLMERHGALTDEIAGTLLVEFIEHPAHEIGGELFVGIRQTRDFGPVIAAGLGGLDTEYLASRLRPGVSVAKSAVMNTTAAAFFQEFKKTAAYEILSGKVRGHESVVGDGELMRCFSAFLAIARRFCAPEQSVYSLEELEVNPFAFQRRRLIPLDGRGRLGKPVRSARPRPLSQVKRMLEPCSIAVAGVSSKRANLGRIILSNIVDCGFPRENLVVIKEGEESIDGVRCVPDPASLKSPVDLLVAATPAEGVFDLVRNAQPALERSARCGSIILIPGALGEKGGTEGVHHALHRLIDESRAVAPGSPVVLGGNCLGVRSRPGRYDTFFIPDEKLDPRREQPPKRCALISQSGGFLISRMSNLEFLDPAFAVSIGNQVDVTVSDVLNALADRRDLDCIGVYVEGFNELDGLAFLDAVQRSVATGKVIVFYKAGRTAAGRSAAQGHTASMAGDYDICLAAVASAGAIVTETFKEFEQLMELSTYLHGKQVNGRRIGGVTNAGYEAVGMADTISGARYNLEMPELANATRTRLSDVLARHGVGRLADAKNPLDLTPMASDAAYEEAIRVFLDADEMDAVVVGCVPMTPSLLTTPLELYREDSIAHRLTRVFSATNKPLVAVIDCAGPYEELARTIRSAGVPMFRSADQAVRSLGRYLCHRVERRAADAAAGALRKPGVMAPRRRSSAETIEV